MPQHHPTSSPSSSAAALPCQKLVSILEEKYPSHKGQIQSAQQLLQKAIAAFDAAAPHLAKLWQHCVAVKTKLLGESGEAAHAGKVPLDDLVPLLMGLVFCFFGSSFLLLFTVLATLRLVCWDSMRENFQVLRENYEIAKRENEKDNLVDDDGNGIPDVEEIDQKEYLSRKVKVFVKSIDVGRVNAAMKVLLSGVMSVVATLRVSFAKRLTLSASLANAVAPYLRIAPFLRENVLDNNEQQKLAGLLEKVILHSFCFVLSLLLSKFMYMLYCAVRGADLFVFFSLKLAIRMKWIQGEDYGIEMEGMEATAAEIRRGRADQKLVQNDKKDKQTHIDQGQLSKDELLKKKFTISNFSNPKIKLFLVVVATMGFLFQLAHHDGLPFPFNVILLPFTIAEYALTALLSILLVM